MARKNVPTIEELEEFFPPGTSEHRLIRELKRVREERGQWASEVGRKAFYTGMFVSLAILRKEKMKDEREGDSKTA